MLGVTVFPVLEIPNQISKNIYKYKCRSYHTRGLLFMLLCDFCISVFFLRLWCVVVSTKGKWKCRRQSQKHYWKKLHRHWYFMIVSTGKNYNATTKMYKMTLTINFQVHFCLYRIGYRSTEVIYNCSGNKFATPIDEKLRSSLYRGRELITTTSEPYHLYGVLTSRCFIHLPRVSLVR